MVKSLRKNWNLVRESDAILREEIAKAGLLDRDIRAIPPSTLVFVQLVLWAMAGLTITRTKVITLLMG